MGKVWLSGLLRIEFEAKCFAKRSALPLDVDIILFSEKRGGFVEDLTYGFDKISEYFVTFRTGEYFTVVEGLFETGMIREWRFLVSTKSYWFSVKKLFNLCGLELA